MSDRPKCFGKMIPQNLTPCTGCIHVNECFIRAMLSVREASGEYADFPTASQHRMAITTAVPYHWRWQINNLKLMLNDLKDLKEKHKVPHAEELYNSIHHETHILCQRMWKMVQEQIQQREKVSE